MDWTTPLRSQQADFIERLKSGHLLYSDLEGTHSKLTTISDENETLESLLEFTWDLTEKFKVQSHVKNTFTRNFIGQLGEEVVKKRLGNLITRHLQKL
jgi:hypothetical protein